MGEFRRKCEAAKEEMRMAMEEAAARKKAKEEAERTYVAEQQADMDGKEAANRAAVQARLDQIDRNCATLGAEIAGRDARAEAQLQESIRRVLEESDRRAKEDTERRRSEHKRKTTEMLNTLDEQCRERIQAAEKEREEGLEQARIFKEECEAGLAKDRADEERRRKAREEMDERLIGQMRSQLAVHPRNFLVTGATQDREVSYNRSMFEVMQKEGFMNEITGKLLSRPHKKGGIDPYPSVARYEGSIHPLELEEEEVN